MKNPLFDILPAKYRRYVYALVALIVFGSALYQAADGDWRKFAALFLASLVPATAHANTPAE